MAANDDGFMGRYRARCQQPNCPGERVFDFPRSGGLEIGQVMPADPSVPGFGRCPHCKRYQMKVTETPVKPPPPKPKGFTKVPTE